MPITVKVKGQTGNHLNVNGESQIPVVVHPHPPVGEQKSAFPYRSYFKDFDNAESIDMAVNGATTNASFCIQAVKEYDTYIKTISILIADASQTLQEFANSGAALTNGVLFEWSSSDLGTTTIHDGLKTNFDFIRLALGDPSIGDGATAFLANNAIATNIEAYIPVLDLAKTFGLVYGIRLRKGTADKLVFTIRDNCTAADQFDAIGYGIQI
jgi:hypothetical protein